MSKLYMRKLSLILANDDTELELADLRVVFKVNQWDLQTPNSCVATIYNVSKETQVRAQREAVLPSSSGSSHGAS